MSDSNDLREALQAFDWFVRVYTPTFLRLARLEEYAQKLAKLAATTAPLDSISVRVDTRDLLQDIQGRRKELPPGLQPFPERVWPQVSKLLGSAEIPGIPGKPNDMLSVASDLTDVTDTSAKIAIANGWATAEEVDETERTLAQQLAAVLRSPS